jgi:hypothetical protein
MHAIRATGPDSRDAEIARLASRHNRVVTRPQLVAAGLTRSAVAHRIAKQRLHGVHPGVYLLDEPGTASRITLFTAAVYACGAQALLSHRSAAELWEFAPDRGAGIDETL